MKTSFWGVLLALLIAVKYPSYSQNYFRGHAGITFMDLTESYNGNSVSSSRNTNMALGIGWEAGISKYIALQTELNFIGKGYRIDAQNKASLAYIELPVLFKGKIPVEDILEFYINVGPSIAYGTGGTVTSRGTDYKDVFGTNGFKRLDYGLQYGGGMSVFFKNRNKISADVRLYSGWANLYPPNSLNITATNGGMYLLLSYSRNIH